VFQVLQCLGFNPLDRRALKLKCQVVEELQGNWFELLLAISERGDFENPGAGGSLVKLF